MGCQIVAAMEAALWAIEIHPEKIGGARWGSRRRLVPSKARIFHASGALVSTRSPSSGNLARTSDDSARVLRWAGRAAPTPRASERNPRSLLGALAPARLRALASQFSRAGDSSTR